ncbi:hypothetical protein Y032_0315g2257 [Ancylostoma ceylanicum]|nr:hypothetical protein Y032_0315g2257 [Ancylostoma ceylanicum]
MDVHMAVLLLAYAAAAQDCTLVDVTGQTIACTLIGRHETTDLSKCARKCYDKKECVFCDIKAGEVQPCVLYKPGGNERLIQSGYEIQRQASPKCRKMMLPE